jgi:hypothetical protein
VYMVTISQVVKKIIDARPTLQESLIEGIISYANLAEHLHERIEKEMDKPVKTAAIVMALRRHAEKIQKKAPPAKAFKLTSEIIMKTGLGDLTIVKTPSAVVKMQKLHDLVDHDKGESLNIIQGNYEITVVIPQKYMKKVREILKGEKIVNEEKDLVSLTLTLTKEFFTTPGIIALASRKLSWENINIFENISTMTELIFIISEKDATRAYTAFKEMMVEVGDKN